MNPYTGTDFFSFFGVLFSRLFSWSSSIATDEIQLLVLIGVGLSSALIGTFLVLKQMTMLANSLSHTLLLGIVAAYLITGSGLVGSLGLTSLLIASLITALCTSLLTQFLTGSGKLQEDASIGIVFTTLFAIGVVLVTLFTRNAHIGTEMVMGNSDALHVDDIWLTYAVLLLNGALITLFFKEFKITAFDPGLARSSGISTNFFNYLLMILIALTAIVVFRAVGLVLVLAFFVGPPLIARELTHRLAPLLFISMGTAAVCALLSVALSRHVLTVYQAPFSTGAILVTLIGLFYFTLILIKRLYKRGLMKKSVSVTIPNN